MPITKFFFSPVENRKRHKLLIWYKVTGFASIQQVKSRVNSGDLKNRLKKKMAKKRKNKSTIGYEGEYNRRITMTTGHLHEQVIHDVVVVSSRSIG